MENRVVIKIDAELDDIQRELNQLERQASDAGDRAGKELGDGIDKGTESGLNNLRQRMVGIAKAFAAGFVFTQVIRGIGTVRREFASFENEINSVRTLLNSNSFGAQNIEQGFAGLRTGVLQTLREIPVELSALNKSLFDTVSAGVDAGKALDVVGAAGKLAVAGLTDVSTATDGITTALNAFQIDAKDAERVAGQFFTAQKLGKTTIDELAGSIGNVASTAAATGVSFEELLASVTAATTGGIQTSQAFNGIKAALSNILKPTADAAKEAERLGIAFSAQGIQESGGFVNFLDDIREKTGGSIESLSKLFGSVEALNVVSSLTGNQSEALANAIEQIGNSAASTQTLLAAYQVQSQGLENQSKILSNNFQSLRLEIGTRLLPVFEALNRIALSLVQGFRTLITDGFGALDRSIRLVTITLGIFLARLAGGAIITRAVSLFGVLGRAFVALRANITAASIAANFFRGAILLGLPFIIDGFLKIKDELGGLENLFIFVGGVIQKTFLEAQRKFQDFVNSIVNSRVFAFFSDNPIKLQIDTTDTIRSLVEVENTLDRLAENVGNARLSSGSTDSGSSAGAAGGISGGPASVVPDFSEFERQQQLIQDSLAQTQNAANAASNSLTSVGGVNSGLDLEKLTADQLALQQFVQQNVDFVQSNTGLVDSIAGQVAGAQGIIDGVIRSAQSGGLTAIDSLNQAVAVQGEVLAIGLDSNLVAPSVSALNAIQERADAFGASFGANMARQIKAATGFGRQMRQTFSQVSSGALKQFAQAGGRAFAEFAGGLATGEAKLKDFGKVIFSLIGDVLFQLGTQLIAAGIGNLIAQNYALGGAQIAGGGLIAAAGKVLSSKGGSPSSGSTTPSASAPSVVTPSVPAVSTTPQADPDSDFANASTQRGASINVNIAGDVLDSDETSLRIIDLIEQAGFLGAEVPT